MSYDPRDKPIGALPPPEGEGPSTTDAEDLRRVVSRAHIEGAVQDENRVETLRLAREREDRAHAEALAWLEQQEYVGAVEADARARRADGTMSFAQAAGVATLTTAAGMMLGGPIGGIVGFAVGAVVNHVTRGDRR
jgi:hypothetical protein